VFRVALNGGGQRQGVVLRPALGGGHPDHAEFGLGQRAGLVEDDGIDQARLLEGEPVADEDPVASPEGGRDGDDQRDSQAEGMGASDDQHRCHPGDDFVIETDGDRPGHGRDGGYADGDVEEPAGGLVGQDLGARLALLGLLDKSHDSGDRRVGAGRRYSHAQAPVAVDRPGDDAGAGGFSTADRR
jgi:hypothetical protein